MALEQHAIPSQVTAYEFRLVGDMTLKQFGWLASGIVLAIVIHSLPLPGYIRWPLILLFAPAGALIAFVPIEGRGIDRWIIAFIKAIYSPTEYIWRQEMPLLEIFKKSTYQPSTTTAKVTQQDQTKLEEYLHSLPHVEETDQLDQLESQNLKQIEQLFSDSDFQSSGPLLQPSVISEEINDSGTQFTSDSHSDENKPFVDGEPVSPSKSEVTPLSPQEKSLSAEAGSPSPPPVMNPQLQQIMSQPSKIGLSQDQNIPIKTKPAAVAPSGILVPSSEHPNVISGMVTDLQGKIIDNAIIEIKDKNHKPVRALKTNKLGQFAIATSLKEGQYIIEVDKDGYQFEPVIVQAQGEIIPPVLIKAK